MPVPWLQIVRLVPSLLDVSRELLGRTRRLPTPVNELPITDEALAQRIASLEDNERRQAELVSQMAEQISALTHAVTSLHTRVLWLTAGCGVAVIVALVAVVIAV